MKGVVNSLPLKSVMGPRPYISIEYHIPHTIVIFRATRFPPFHHRRKPNQPFSGLRRSKKPASKRFPPSPLPNPIPTIINRSTIAQGGKKRKAFSSSTGPLSTPKTRRKKRSAPRSLTKTDPESENDSDFVLVSLNSALNSVTASSQ